MVTPSSSVTSPSPPTTYAQPHSPSLSTDMDPSEREERDKAIRKFLASAELSVWAAPAVMPPYSKDPGMLLVVLLTSAVVRGLRARLSYASYKATNNIPHISLNDLEAKTRAMMVTPSRLIGTKRKATGGTNYNNNSATQGSSTRRAGNLSSPSVSASSTTAASRSHHYPTGTTSYSNPPQSLYTALLGPPPLKQARTVHNSADPPVQAPSRSTAGSRTRSRRGKNSAHVVRSIAEGTRAQSRHRKEEASRVKPRSSKGKRKVSAEEATDVERKAVATLTSLLQSRPSIASTSSPRSSLSAGSEGSFLSHSQYAQSSARTTTAPSSLLPSTESSFSIPTVTRAATPPRVHNESIYSTSTPRADDEEAANLMLYLHTSPSPARPTTTRDRDAKDLTAFRALGGAGSLRSKGRVLFSGGDDGRSPLRSESSFTIDTLPGSQNSQTMSQPHRLDPVSNHAGSLAPSAPMQPMVVPPTPVPEASPTPSQLLPAPLSPPGQTEALFPQSQAPPTPGSVPFNLNDFINVSPSPATSTVPRSAISLKSGLGANLRTDLGRKLFEEEQHRHQHLTASYNHGDGLRHEKNGSSLGASIDLSTR
ncbi:hypothetical protein L210DRAFT_3644356 [Boletus edulis BED1]|uniref:Uncharacterized protein n=1 Tax=Boletus edulis BED1 TaxID=1328754 RepID=A0AAD4BWS1_BOLED|nr:hypothetical protein L210DRAFT_3644356 [Boletus edulis BED1]